MSSASRRVNVLVYSGTGATTRSIQQCLYTLRRLLTPRYAVLTTDSVTLLSEPWSATTALLVFPGGGDLGYCRALNGEGNRRIAAFVNRGGAYLGFCAGGYYGSARCEFEVGDPKMEVVGPRELGFFPGTCRGLAFEGFVYSSEAGARAVEMEVDRNLLPHGEKLKQKFVSYYNGGGVYVDARKLTERGVEILASYTEKIHVKSGEGKAAIVYRKIGEGAAILTGPHPEFSAANLRREGNGPEYGKLVDAVAADESARTAFLQACFRKLGLEVNDEEQVVPSLTPIHLSAHDPSDVSELLVSWAEVITLKDGNEYVNGEHDTFQIDKSGSAWSTGFLKKTIEAVGLGGDKGKEDSPNKDETETEDRIIKSLIAHETALPTTEETPHFNHKRFFEYLNDDYNKYTMYSHEFGRYLMYGEVVTSTNTLLEKNFSLLAHLPSGLTFVARTQINGRGRGSNVWVAPPGALMFSTIIRHPMVLSQTAPVIFVQYLAGLAAVCGTKNYSHAHSSLRLRLKWPNDIYALDPRAPTDAPENYVKVGGVLLNSSFAGAEYMLVAGVGVNVANPSPTTNLNAIAAAAGLPSFEIERLLADVLVNFETLYAHFARKGWGGWLEKLYHENWLHTDQVVILEADGSRARIKGINPQTGLLIAEELAFGDRETGRMVQLQSDSNSFDFFKGLIKRKF